MPAVSQPRVITNTTTLGWPVKIAYGMGEMANAIKLLTFGLYALFFATVVEGLPGAWVGIVALLSTVWDAFIDPFVGFHTDGPQSFSKRFKCMLAGASTVGLGLWAFFSPPHGLSTVMLFVWLLVASFALRTAASIFSIPYYAIGVRLSQDYHERTSITAIRNISTAVGTLLAASLSSIFFFADKVPRVDPKLDSKAYSTMGFVFGAIMTLAALVAVFSTFLLRHRVAAESSEVALPRSQAPVDYFASMRGCLRNPSFRVVLTAASLVTVGLAVNASLLIHYLKYYAEANGSVALASTQAAYYGVGLFGTLFWLRVSSRFEKHLLYVFSAAATAALMLGGQWLFGKGHPLGTGNLQPLLIGYGLAGFFGCMLWFLPASMLADVADESQLLTGARPEGALFGMLSLAKQVATGVAVLLAGGLLQVYVKLVPGSIRLSDLAAHRIGVAYSVVPAALVMGAAVVMLRYKLTRSRVELIQTQLHQQGVEL